MSERKLIFYDDARHYHYYIYEPPMTLAQATATIDAVAGTGVDTFVWGPGLGPTVFYESQKADVFAEHLEVIGDVASWRAYENSMDLIKRGLDPMRLMVERAHQLDMDFIPSYRLTHSSDPKDMDNAHNWKFKIDHPEWVLKGDSEEDSRKNGFNWIYPEVRKERFDILEEAVNKYDIDGLELDLTFDPYYFESYEVESNMSVLTSFLKDLRNVSEEASVKKNKKISIGARIFPSLKANSDAGFDLVKWVDLELLDFLVPNVYSHIPIDPNFKFDWVLDICSKKSVKVYPALGSIIGANRERYAGLEYYRAAAAAYWDRGVDGLYIPWFPWPIESEQRQILREIGDIDVISEKSKRYYVAPKHEANMKFGHESYLPLELITGVKAKNQTVKVYIAEKSKFPKVNLIIKLKESTFRDEMEILINGNVCKFDETNYTPLGFTHALIEIPIDRNVLVSGDNEIGVGILSRPEKLTGTVILEEVDVSVTYPNATV